MGSRSVRRRWPSRLAFLASASCLALIGCGGDSEDENAPDPALPAQMYDYVTLSLRPPFSQFRDRTPATNPVTNAGATLGRVLFYDKHLSRNNTKACGSCHLQSLAFTDGLEKAVGFDGQHTLRNAMTLSNLRFQRSASDPRRDQDDDFFGEGEEDFLTKARQIRRYGAGVVVMAFDEVGQAETVARKVEICQRAYRLLTTQAGFDPEDIANPLDPENMLKSSGRGIFFMRNFMDDVSITRRPEGGMDVRMSKKLA